MKKIADTKKSPDTCGQGLSYLDDLGLNGDKLVSIASSLCEFECRKYLFIR